jgi:DNA-binding MarR family transcriptional regulator
MPTPSATAFGPVVLAETPGYLIRRAQQVHNTLWTELLATKVTPPQFSVLTALSVEGGVDQRRLGELASLDKSSVADVVARLTAQRWIERARDPDDGRRNLLHLAPAAEIAVRHLSPVVDEVQTRLLAPLDDSETEVFLRSLRAVARADEAAVTIPLGSAGHLIRCAQQVHTALWGEAFGGELTGPQCAVLFVISGTPEIAQKHLGELAALDRSTAADLIARLESRGWVLRDRSPSDARVKTLLLTDEGREVVDRAGPGVQPVQDRLLSPLDPAEQSRFMDQLRRIAFPV